MQRITIYENDKTVNSSSVTYDIGAVLIPGFASAAESPVGVGELVECTSEYQFKNHFGKTAPIFKETQYYPYSGEVQSVDTQETYTALLKAYPLDAKLYTTEKEGGYKKGECCLYNYSLYKALAAIDTPPAKFDEAQWKLILADSAVVKVTRDDNPEKPAVQGKTTYYQYRIEKLTDGTFQGKFDYVSVEQGVGFPDVAIPKSLETETYSTVHMFEAGDQDPSWHMALRLINAGLSVIYVRMNECTDSTLPEYDVTRERAYKFMTEELFVLDDEVENYNPITDKGLNIAFITSGGWPSLEYNTGLALQMCALAEYNSSKKVTGRGDCVALLDHTNNKYRALTGPNSVFESTSTFPTVPDNRYAAVFTPWCTTQISHFTEVPASFVYLYTMAQGLISGNVWDIFAGVNKGRCNIITGLNTNSVLTNRIAEYYQNDFTEDAKHSSINPITYVRNYGYCIWGDRTCEKYRVPDEGFALAFLHIRNLVNAVKKQSYVISQSLMFQNNNDVLWANFRLGVGSLLDKMVNSGGLKSYKFVRESNGGDATRLNVRITLYPSYGLERVVLSVDLENDAETTIEEYDE